MIRIGVDVYVLDTLMRELVGNDKKPSAFLVYLHLWRRSRGGEVAWVQASHQQVARATGLSKSAVQDAIKVLSRRKLIRSVRATRTSAPKYDVRRPWGRGTT
jgi:DNA-binding MarR family transcriptional regulator